MLLRDPRRPAVPFALAFLAGAALGPRVGCGHGAAATIFLLGASGLLFMGLRRLRPVAALLLCLFAGALCALQDERASEKVIREVLPTRDSTCECSVSGRVMSAAERDRKGNRWILLRGRPDSPNSRPESDLTIRLQVFSAPTIWIDALDDLRRGDRIRVWCRLHRSAPLGNPGEKDPEPALRAKGIDVVGTVKSARLFELVGPGPWTLRRALDDLKVRARSRLDEVFGQDRAARGMLGAMLLGDRGGVDERAWEDLRISGLVHLLSVSGLHVALVLGVLVFVLERLRLGVRTFAAVCVAAFVSLGLFIGDQPPVWRSVLSASAMLSGRALGRQGDAVNTLALVAAGMVAWRPALLDDLGFQLSFLATAGILTRAGGIARSLPLPRGLALPVGVSASAYLATLPASLWHFGRAAPIGVLSNLLATALTGGAMSGGLAAMAIGDLPFLGAATKALGRVACTGLLRIAEWAAGVPGGSFRVGAPAPWLLAAHAILFFLVIPAARKEPTPRGTPSDLVRRSARGLAFAEVIILLHLGAPPSARGGGLELVLLSVGQGQCLLLRAPGGKVAVIDAGPSSGGRFDSGQRVVAPFLGRWGCARIETLVLSHGHDDHVGGARSLLREMEVGEIWLPRGAHRDPKLREIRDEAVRRGAAPVLLAEGKRFLAAGIPIEVLDAPVLPGSVVVRAGSAPCRILCPGDIGGAKEQMRLLELSDPRAEALLVPHHGAESGTSDELLGAVDPVIALISVGKSNRFGHPAPATLERIGRRGTEIHRTDLEGAIFLRCGREGWETLPTERWEPE
jgi:competence protein ComEC